MKMKPRRRVARSRNTVFRGLFLFRRRLLALQVLQAPRALLPVRVPILAKSDFVPSSRQGIRRLPLLVDDEGPAKKSLEMLRRLRSELPVFASLRRMAKRKREARKAARKAARK